MERFIHVINRINGLVGVTISYLVIAHIAVIVWGVLLRYVFESPLLWPDEMSLFLFGAYAILGGGYTLLQGEHVKVDILHRHLSKRGVAILDLITFPLFLIFCGVLLWKGTKLAWISVIGLERSWSVWGPPVWPIKLTLAIGAFLIVIQGLAKFSQDLIVAQGKGGKKT